MKTFEPQTIVNARFMPDGQGIVFSSALTGNAVRLFQIQAGLTEARPFGPADTHLLSVSSKGELAVLTKLSSRIALKNSFTVAYDDTPPDGVKRYDTQLELAVIVTF